MATKFNMLVLTMDPVNQGDECAWLQPSIALTGLDRGVTTGWQCL